jgi:hypothetical protein
VLVEAVPATAPLVLNEPDALVELWSVLVLEVLGVVDELVEDDVLGVVLATV